MCFASAVACLQDSLNRLEDQKDGNAMSDSSRATLETESQSARSVIAETVSSKHDEGEQPTSTGGEAPLKQAREPEATLKSEEELSANDEKPKSNNAPVNAGSTAEPRRIILEHFEMYKTESVRQQDLENVRQELKPLDSGSTLSALVRTRIATRYSR